MNSSTTQSSSPSSSRLPQNAPGEFYVTADCIDCDLCREVAPDTFRRHNDIGFTIVHRQPMTPDERASAIEALAGCPIEAIQRDTQSPESIH